MALTRSSTTINNTASVLLSTNADDDRVEVVHDAIVAKRDHGAGRTGEEQGPGRSEHSGVADSAASAVWVPQVSRGRDQPQGALTCELVTTSWCLTVY